MANDIESSGSAPVVERENSATAEQSNQINDVAQIDGKTNDSVDSSTGQENAGLERSSFLRSLNVGGDQSDQTQKAEFAPEIVNYVRNLFNVPNPTALESSESTSVTASGVDTVAANFLAMPAANDAQVSAMDGTNSTTPNHVNFSRTTIENTTPSTEENKSATMTTPEETPLPKAAVPAPKPEVATSLPSAAQTDLNTILNGVKNQDGKTLGEQAQQATAEALFKYPDAHKDKPDDISKYALSLQAETLLARGADFTDKANYTAHLTSNEMFHAIDSTKVSAGKEAYGNSAQFQQWLADTQKANLEKGIEDSIARGAITDPGKDAQTGSRVDTLIHKQDAFLTDPAQQKLVGQMAPEKQAEYYKDVAKTYAVMGDTPAEIEAAVARAAGTPVPLVNAQRQLVMTAEGNVIAQPAKTDTLIALDKANGTVVKDTASQMPLVYNAQGQSVKDGVDKSVVLTPTGQTVTVGNKGNLKLVNNKTGADIKEAQTGNNLYVDSATAAVVAKDASGNILRDKVNQQPLVYKFDNTTNTGQVLTNKSGNPIIVNEKTSATAEIDKITGEMQRDADGNAYYVNRVTGGRQTDATGRPVVFDEKAQVTVVTDQTTGVKTVWNPGTQALAEDKEHKRSTIVNPDTNQVIAVALDANNQPQKSADGRYVEIDDKTDVHFVGGEVGQKLVVNDKGELVRDSNQNQLVIDPKSSFVIAQDSAGDAITDGASGGQFVYDPRTGYIVQSAAGNLVALNPASGMPGDLQPNGTFSIDANGNQRVINPQTGASLKDPKGNDVVVLKGTTLTVAAVKVSFGADGPPLVGETWVVNPYIGRYVTTPEGRNVAMLGTNTAMAVDSWGRPQFYTVDKTLNDASANNNLIVVLNPATGQQLLDENGRKIMQKGIDGRPQSFDPATKKLLPVPPQTEAKKGLDGKELTNPQGQVIATDGMTGRTVLLDPDTHQVVTALNTPFAKLADDNGKEIKTAEGQSVVVNEKGTLVAVDVVGEPLLDRNGNTLVYAKDGKLQTDLAGNQAVLSKENGAPVLTAKDSGELLSKSGYTLAANVNTGQARTDASGNYQVVLDKEFGAPVQMDKNGNIVKDEKLRTVVASPLTGERLIDGSGKPVVLDEKSGLPISVSVSADGKVEMKSVWDPITGKALEDPNTGARMIINRDGNPEVVKLGNDGTTLLVWDPVTNQQRTDPLGRPMFIDAATQQTVARDANNQLLNVYTGLPPDISSPATFNNDTRKALTGTRSALNEVYWSSVSFSELKGTTLKDTDFVKSRGFRMAMGAFNVVNLTALWAPGSPGFQALKNKDPKAILSFGRDFSSSLSAGHNGLKFAEYINRKGIIFPDIKISDDGTIVRSTTSGSSFKYETYNATKGQWVGVQDPERAAAVARATGSSAYLGDYARLNSQTKVMEYFNSASGSWQREPVKFDFKAIEGSEAGPVARNYNAIRTTMKYLDAGGNIGQGGFGIAVGVMNIVEGSRADKYNPLQIAQGSFEIASGTTFVAQGLSSMTGLLPAASPFLYAGGFALGLVALGLSIAQDPKGFLYGEAGTWADNLTKKFAPINPWRDGVDAESYLRDLMRSRLQQGHPNWWAVGKLPNEYLFPEYFH